MTQTLPAPTATAHPSLTVALPVLLNALNTVGVAVSTRPPVPVLGGVRFDVAGGVTTLSAFDFETSMRVTVDTAAATDGSALLNHAELVKVLKAATKGETAKTWHNWTVDITSDTDGASVTVAGFTVPVTSLPLDEYPALPEPAARPTVTLSRAALGEMLRQVTVAAGTDETLPVFTGIRLELDSGTLTAACTDRFRLAVATLPVDSTESGAWLLPVRELGKMFKAFTDDDVVFGLPETDGWATVRSSAVTATVRTMDHEFPRFRLLMPTDVAHHATVNRAALRRAAVKAEALASTLQGHRGEGIVTVTVGAGQVTVAPYLSEQRDRVHGVKLPAATIGDVTFGIAGHRLVAALDSLTGDDAALGCNAPGKPILFAEDVHALTRSDAAYRHLVMPCRIAS